MGSQYIEQMVPRSRGEILGGNVIIANIRLIVINNDFYNELSVSPEENSLSPK